MEFSFSVNWDLETSEFKVLLDAAFEFANNKELRRVSIERGPYHGQMQYQVFTNKNGACSPQPSIEAAYGNALARIDNR